MLQHHSVVMLGATGAVGSHAAFTLAQLPGMQRLTLLGRRPAENITGSFVAQHAVGVLQPDSYQALLPGHDAAICALGVGEPSKMDKAQFVQIDRDAVLDFARACKQSGVRHFELLCAIGANAQSSSFYLRTKGELEDGLKALNFERLSLFEPSMIITPANRYGVGQAVLLKAMPLIDHALIGSLHKFRSIRAERLGAALAMNLLTDKPGVETLHWDDFMALSNLQAMRDLAGSA